jgi:hypothetical protein
MKKLVKEGMEPMGGPDMKDHDAFIGQHEESGFVHHSKHYKKHGASFPTDDGPIAALSKNQKYSD